MKEIKAYIRNERLEAVVNSLAQVPNLSGVSVNTITGFGRSRGVLRMVDFETHIKIETVCADDVKHLVVNTILKHAGTGSRGDGKIFVSDISEAWRIETQKELKDSP